MRSCARPRPSGTQPIKAWWPGTNYVTWVGIDGYYLKPSDTFSSVFGGALDASVLLDSP